MFSSTFPAATSSSVRSTSTADTVTARGAATGSAQGGRSFDDALSAASGDDDADAPVTSPAHAPASPRAFARAHAHAASIADASTEHDAAPGHRRPSRDVLDAPAISDEKLAANVTITVIGVFATQDAAPPIVATVVSGTASAPASGTDETDGGAPKATLPQLAPAVIAGASQDSIDSSDLGTDQTHTPASDDAPTRTSLPARALTLAASNMRQQQMAGAKNDAADPAAAPKSQSSTSSFSSGVSASTTAAAAVDTTTKPAVSATPREASAATLSAPSLTATRTAVVTAVAPTLTAVTTPALTPSVSTSAPETLPPSVTQQIIEAIRMQWSAGRGTAQIELEPSHFGELSVSLRVEQGQVTARLEASSPAVREWLQTNESSLRHGLAEQNLTLDRLEVTEPPESQDAERRGQQQPSREERQPRRPQRRDTGELFEIVA